MRAAIHQPNFFPWPGYFAKIARTEVFVFLDAVEFSAGSYINRVRLLFGGAPAWATCPVEHGSGAKKINAVAIGRNPRWQKKLLAGLEQNYGKAPYFHTVFPLISSILERDWDSLAALNITAIEALAALLQLETVFKRQSGLTAPGVQAESGSNRLAAICREVGAGSYLAGGGSLGYEDLAAYSRAGIRFERFAYSCPSYPQRGRGTFVPGLSIIDMLCNVGLNRARELLFEGAE